MSRILFTWELGLATGHLHKLGSILPATQELGHEVIVAAKDPILAQRILGTDNIRHIAAPYWSGYEKGLPAANNYNEVLFHSGYLDKGRVSALLKAWIDIIHLTRAELVVAEHSPTALIAAHICQIPTLVLGTGFTIPPNTSPLPSLKPWLSLNHERSNSAEKKLLRTVNESITELGGNAIRHTAEIFHQNDPVLLTLPELDHYGKRRGAHYWGAHLSRTQNRPTAVWPTHEGEKVFVYMSHTHPHYRDLLLQLRESRFSTLVVSPEIHPQYRRQLSANNIRISTQQVDIDTVVSQCRITFNHAAHGTMANLLSHGKPFIMLPTHVEQAVIAHRAEEQSFGITIYGPPNKNDYISTIEELLDSPIYNETAEKFSSYYRENPLRQEDLSENIKREVTTLL